MLTPHALISAEKDDVPTKFYGYRWDLSDEVDKIVAWQGVGPFRRDRCHN